MNFLKKNYKIIVFAVGICVIIVGFCIIMFHKPNGKCDIITVKNDYYVINSDAVNYLNIPLYFSMKDPAFLKQDNIERIHLITEDKEDIIPLSIKEINFLKEIKDNDEIYYQYDLKVAIDLVIDSLTIYDDIYLEIEYVNSVSIKLLIGSISIYNYKSNNELQYTNLKGIVKSYNQTKMLQCVAVKLNTKDDIKIIDIRALNNKVNINMEDSVVINNIDLSNMKLEDYVDADYNIIGNSTYNRSFDISDEDYLLIYLKYDKYIEMTCCGFVITYLKDNVLYEKVINPFMYYKTNSLLEEIVKVTYDANNY